MKVVKGKDAQIYKNSIGCVAFEYLIESEAINLARIKLNCRYPDKGRAMNLECKEVVHIAKGKGKLVVEGQGAEKK